MTRLTALTATLLLLGGFVSCRDETPSSPAGRGPGEAVPILGGAPKFRLVDQTGGQYGSADLRGKVWVADFIFTRCQSMCPMLTAEMMKLQEELRGDPLWSDIRLVSFSIDPVYDQPAILAKYAQQHGADRDHWRFLTGTREEIWSLSKDGFKLAVGVTPEGEDEPLFHSQQFVLGDREGRIRGYYDALDPQSREVLLSDMRAVLAEASVAKAPAAAKPRTVVTPPEAENPRWPEPRAEAQRRAAKTWNVFHDFHFVDRQPESGITFRHKIVDDAGKHYKSVHYDHGSGVAVADVDGDGHYDVYFVSQIGHNELWRNLGDGRFEDITWQAGVALLDRVGVGASFADIDNDGDADLYVANVRGGNVLFENDGKGNFTNISRASGTDYDGHSSSAVFFDYDRDGLLDLFVVNVGKYTMEKHVGNYYEGFRDAFGGHLKPERYERSVLYRNQGDGRFVDVSEKVGLVDNRWSGDAIPIDVSGDGWIDLYVLNMQGLDGYYENVGGKRFVSRGEEVFPKSSWGAMGVKAFDFDNDGDMDIFISDMHSDMSQVVSVDSEKAKADMQYSASYLQDDGKGIYGNTFFRNEGDGTFSEVSDEVGAENFWPWGLSVGDLNADGFEDVFVAASMNYPFRYAINSVLLNEGGHFVDAEFVLGVEPRRNGRTITPWFEIDCAGVDRYHRDCPKGFADVGRVQVYGALGTRSSAIFDIDGDGDLDIVTNDFNSEPMVLVSDLSERKPIRYLGVKLEGTKSNRSGLGARVTVQAGGKIYTKVHDGQSGYLSQGLYPLYFGLGRAAQVDEIRVVWPSGHEQTLPGPIETNRFIEIREGT